MDWRKFFADADTLMIDLKSNADGNLDATWVKTERLYQAFKQRLLEETTACQIPDLNKCPECGGAADNGNDRCVPTNPYNCSKCQTPEGK